MRHRNNIQLALMGAALMVLGMACSQIDKQVPFEKPTISQPITSVKTIPFEATQMLGIDPVFAGKHAFCPSLHFADDLLRFPRPEKDFLDEVALKTPPPYPMDSLRVVPDYPSTVRYRHIEEEPALPYYPVHLVNETATTHILRGKDNHIFGIQEALDSTGKWWPIEEKGFVFCGNGSWGILVHPREFVTILFPKYQGDTPTLLRVRIKNGDHIYVSEPFPGTICPEQFHFGEFSQFYFTAKYGLDIAVQELFYGATPMDMMDSVIVPTLTQRE